MEKRLYSVAVDEPFGNPDPDEHSRDAIYLVWLDDADRDRLVRETDGRVSMWEPGICSVDGFLESWSDEHQVEEDE
jgi:hypothetical protein